MLEASPFLYPLILLVFGLGYLAIIFEYTIKINKTAVALLIAVLCWVIYFTLSVAPVSQDLKDLGVHVSDVSQIIFFLMGAMTLVELIDSHKGFKIVTDIIRTTSKRKMLWIVAFTAFCLSAVLDNLTTTILMISLLRKMVPTRNERFLLSCVVVLCSNAGGAWTPIGDVTTTMLWINGQLSTLAVMKALILPSIVSMLVPMSYFSFRQKGEYSQPAVEEFDVIPEPGARLVFYLGIGALIFVPIFKTLTGLPPFMGMLIGVAVLWLVTDMLHQKYEHRQHLRVPTVLTKIDMSGVLFFLGILLCINSLESAGILKDLAGLLEKYVGNQPLIATLIGIMSAIIDNVPLVAGTMGMYPLSEFPMDSSLWHMIAYAAGTGGSMLLIGSSAGVALMGLEKIDFFAYMKKMTIPAFVGYLAGMGVYLLQQAL
ncbi:MAG: sodium:proton antiporter NhaD [Simkaniaceae bacterium]|nr:sodium:proton antiporter NhaD [Candidatus Sacchlamyda saccharinae]